MHTKDFDSSSYLDSELVPIYKTGTKLEILKKYLKTKEQKFKKTADNAGITSVITGFISPLTTIATGVGMASNSELISNPSTICLGVVSATGIATSIVSYLIHKKYRAKQRDYKELKEFAEAGISSNIKLEKVQNLIKEEGTANLSTLEKIDTLVTQKQPHYCDINNMIIETDEELVMQK